MNPFVDSEILIYRRAFKNRDGKFIEYYKDAPLPLSVFPDGVIALMHIGGISPTALQVLVKILHMIPEDADKFTMDRRSFADDMGISILTLGRAISVLVNNHVLARIQGSRSVYFINVRYFFKGSRSKFLYSEYGGGQNKYGVFAGNLNNQR